MIWWLLFAFLCVMLSCGLLLLSTVHMAAAFNGYCSIMLQHFVSLHISLVLLQACFCCLLVVNLLRRVLISLYIYFLTGRPVLSVESVERFLHFACNVRRKIKVSVVNFWDVKSSFWCSFMDTFTFTRLIIGRYLVKVCWKLSGLLLI